MKKKVIGIDIDGTLTDPGYFIPFLNKKFNKDIDFKTVKIYDYAELYQVKNDDLRQYFRTDGKDVMFGQDLLENVKDVVLELDSEHKVYIITARKEEFYDNTKNWLNSVGLNNLELFCLGSPEKAELAKKLGCNYFIEDHPTASIEIAKNNIDVLLMDAPYNSMTEHQNIKRIFNWFEIEKFFKEKGVL